MAVEREFWRGKSVFLTGHTGFKGGWLATWLSDMGARVHGFALAPATEPSYFALCGLERRIESTIGDTRNASLLRATMKAARPEIVFHLAAQPLVRRSYRDPALTFETNVIGTVNLLDAVRATPSVRAVVVITSDKCYENHEWAWGYRETDTLGGYDPYSASKACAELVCAAYRRSFFAAGQSQVLLATARAGNVIGGGDWSEDRIVPDAIRAFTRREPLVVRNPHSVRPWQHVLEPLAGYLALAARLYAGDSACADAWNFGPNDENAVAVSSLLQSLISKWGDGAGFRIAQSASAPYEHGCLRLDCSKARELLGWRPRLRLDHALRMTVDWYREALCAPPAAMDRFSRIQIAHYERLLRGDADEVR